MRRALKPSLPARRRDDRGSALLVVIAAMTILSLVVGVALSQAVQTLQTSEHARHWKQALAAAEAGIDDYLARLNRDDTYWQAADCTNQALQGPATSGGGSCRWTASTKPGWLTVPGSSGAEFHYDVSTSSTLIDGGIDLTSTGRSGDVTRSIQVVLRRGGFGEFLYYTVYETLDPADEREYGLNNSTALAKCAQYWWDPFKPRSGATSTCTDIQFAAADTINGPLHTNDAIWTGGATRFLGTVTTSWPTCKPINGEPRPTTSCYRKASGTSNPQFSKGIGYRSEIELPTDLGDLRQHVDATSPNRGCLYTGPTRIVFDPSNTGASQMKVWSPYSKNLTAACGGTAATQTNGTTVAVPQNKLILVQDIPTGWSGAPASGPCANGKIGGYPQSADYSQTLGDANCRYGTVFVEGRLKGRVTISADNNIIVTNDLKYVGGTTGTDALGLIASNNVKIYHPVSRTCQESDRHGRCTRWSDYENMSGPDNRVRTNIEVNASILTLQHSFTVASYEHGNRLGTLKVVGSIAQRYRGPVALGSNSGYAKNYIYDTRLRYAPPPYFLDPLRAAWGQKTYGEIKGKYSG
ncbi:hypothetical protein [Nocardioides dongkuii]|uniref:hypothetical protein n=1 Tax=Nocardioides dongkuii TaxID=2760089 RepID=UPI0015FD689E|nr:hypothetical protein [Nocardioides dongkuii]